MVEATDAAHGRDVTFGVDDAVTMDEVLSLAEEVGVRHTYMLPHLGRDTKAKNLLMSPWMCAAVVI